MCSAQRIARSLDMFVSMVQKILRNILHCYPHRIIHVQDLLPADLPIIRTFSRESLDLMNVDNEWPWNILCQMKPLFISKVLSMHKIAENEQWETHLHVQWYRFLLLK